MDSNKSVHWELRYSYHKPIQKKVGLGKSVGNVALMIE